MEELERQGFELDGIDEELFIQDIEGIEDSSTNWDYCNPQDLFEILKEALAQAKKARLEILDVMESVLPEPREELSKYAPKIVNMKINPDKIKDVIGKGGGKSKKQAEQAAAHQALILMGIEE